MLFFEASDAATMAAAGAKTSVPSRDEIPESDKWDLTRLYPTVEDWEADLEKYTELYPKFADFKGTLADSADRLAECLIFDRELDVLVEKLYHYASLQTSEDGANDEYLTREARLHHVLVLAAEVASYLTPEIQAIEDSQFEAFINSSVLEEWKIRLEKLRRFKPHVLSEKEERLLAMAGMPLSGSQEAFGQLTNVDMKFGEIEDENGNEVELSHSRFSSFLQKPEAELRKNAFHQYYQTFDDHKYTVAATLAYSVKTDVFHARARNYPSAREGALFSDKIPVSVYDNLISSVRSNLDPLFEYYELRREALGLSELHQYDTYVPLIKDFKVNTSFDDACDKVLDSLHPLGGDYVDTLRDGFKSRWVDRYETRGKRSGAFSSSSYGNPPYIMMNYEDDVFSDVYTLAHEAGHSMHSWYSQKHQPFQTYQYPIFLAEVASTFNEELLTYDLLEKTEDPRMRAYIINRQVDDIRGTLIRQTMFAEFEKVIHEMEEAGEALTLDSFRAAYRELLEAYHGPNMVIDDVLELECLRIPHFYSAFYVYKYATGISAAVALSRMVLEGEESDQARYLGFLKSGCSKFPLDTLEAAGVDMSSPEPVEKTLELFAQRVKELGQLLKEL